MIEPTPLLKQYFEFKNQYLDALLFFQVGDFYELFFDDAKVASSVLNITLTKRGTYNGQPVPLCGIPLHVAENYFLKLLQAGHVVAVCSQTEVAQPGKIVARAITNVITPGTITSDSALPEKKAAVVAFITESDEAIQLLIIEFITQTAKITQIAKGAHLHAQLLAELEKISPLEIVISPQEKALKQLFLQTSYKIVDHIESVTLQRADEWIHQNNMNQKYIPSASLFLGYFERYHANVICQYKEFQEYYTNNIMFIDAASQRHLELVENKSDLTASGTLKSILDVCQTAMGSRLLRQWLLNPLVNKEKILFRHKIIEYLLKRTGLLNNLQKLLSAIPDLERICGRIRIGKGSYFDYQKLRDGLIAVEECKDLLHHHEGYAQEVLAQLPDVQSLKNILQKYLFEDVRPSDQHYILPEVSVELTQFDQAIKNQTHIILAFEKAEQERTGMNLKIRQTPLYGYVIEITKAQAATHPPEYKRVQTLSNRERFTSQELKNLEYELLHAQEAYQEEDARLYLYVCDAVKENIYDLMHIAKTFAELDVLTSFAQVALSQRYVKPSMNEEKCLEIIEGKHPILSVHMGHSFIDNDISLSSQQKTWVITGPNMGGKSTFMRQVAQICIMAQIGSWVPAKYANLPILDALFTRIGATDYVLKGKSTFFVEMEEAALICSLATERSLVILDEIGRGTSTYDGMSIACALLEYIHNSLGAFTLFATHYHELYKICKIYNGIGWYNMATKRLPSGMLLLLYKIVSGHSLDSMGIDVAKKVGLPEWVIARATEIKNTFEKES